MRMRPVMGRLRYHARTKMSTRGFRRRRTGWEVVSSSATVLGKFLDTVNLVVVATSWAGGNCTGQGSRRTSKKMPRLHRGSAANRHQTNFGSSSSGDRCQCTIGNLLALPRFKKVFPELLHRKDTKRAWPAGKRTHRPDRGQGPLANFELIE